MSYNTRVVYTATAGQREFDLPFPFISKAHVYALVGGVPRTFSWVSDSRIKLTTALQGGTRIVIERRTPIDTALVSFQAGAVLTQEDLNTAVRQLLYAQQELQDQYDDSIKDAEVRLGDNLGIVVPPADLVDTLLQNIIDSELDQELRSRLVDVDANAEATLRQALMHNTLGDKVDRVITLDLPELGTLIEEETTARIEGQEAIVESLSLLGARSKDNKAWILDLDTVHVGPSESLAERFSSLLVETGDTYARAQIVDEKTARIAGDTAEATARGLLEARVEVIEDAAAGLGDFDTRLTKAESQITTISKAYVDGDTALAEDIETLGSRVTITETDIDGLDTSLGKLTTRVTTAEAGLVSEGVTRASADAAEAALRIALAARVTTAEGAIDSAEGRLTTAEAAIVSNYKTLAAADAAEATARTALTATVNGLRPSFYQSSAPTATAIGDIWYDTDDGNKPYRWDGTSWVEVVDGRWADLKTGYEAAILAEATTRATADSATATLISQIGAMNKANTAFILDTSKVYVDSSTSMATRLSGLDTQVASNASAAATNAASIVTLASTVASGDAANASSITALTATVNQKARTFWASSAPTASGTGDVWFDTAHGNKQYRWDGAAWIDASDSRFASLASDITTVAASVTSEVAARAAGDTAIATELHLLGAMNPGGTAFILDTSKAYVDKSTSMASRLAGLDAAITAAVGDAATASAGIATEASARASADSAIVKDLTVLTSTVMTNTSNIATNTKDIATNAASIVSEASARASADSALASDITGLKSSVGAVVADLATELTTRASADSALSASLSSLSATVTTNTKDISANSAAITAESSARATAVSAVASDVTSLTATVGGHTKDIATANAAISSEASARATAVSAVASDVTTLTSTVSGHTSSITSMDTVIDGLLARASVTLNVDGHVTGWTLNDDGDTGDFIVQANRFAVVDDKSGTPVVPFEVTGGVVKMKDVEIDGDLLVGGSVKTGTLEAYAVNNPVTAYTDGTVSCGDSETTVQSLSITTTGGLLTINFNAHGGPQFVSTTGYYDCWVYVYRDSTLVYDSGFIPVLIHPTDHWVSIAGGLAGFTFSDQPTAGTYTYTVKVRLFHYSSAPSRSLVVSSRYLCVTEIKR